MRRIIHMVSEFIDICVLAVILLLAGFGIYAMWDSNQMYSAAMANQFAEYKPTEKTEGFAELQAINPEVIGWLSLDETGIDYPILQAEENTKYVHTDPKGNYSMTGSLFLDYRNRADFTDFNSIIYGHNMVKEAMFGGLHQFSEKEYFKTHQYGSLYCDGTTYRLEIFAFFTADAYDKTIYAPEIVEDSEKTKLIKEIKKRAIQYRELQVTSKDKILLLSTCTSEMTNGRHLLALKMIRR